MWQYLLRRILMMIPTLFVVSVVAFIVIQLPPGDYLTNMAASMAARGENIDKSALESLRANYGLGEPIYVQYGKWMWGILSRGDFGLAFGWNQPVAKLIGERLALTFTLSLLTLLLTWLIALPVGIFSAVRQYSLLDYIFTFFSFVGLGIPSLVLALVLMYVSFKYFNQSVGGLFSPDMVTAPWSWAKVADLLGHVWIPLIILSLNGTASLMRIMRANLLDELHKPYVITGRAKGLNEGRLLFTYPVRVALNPFVSTIGWSLPTLVSGEIIVAVVLGLPTSGPLLLDALTQQDMYLAGSFILMLSALTVIGTLISDIMLAWLDPRIRFQ